MPAMPMKLAALRYSPEIAEAFQPTETERPATKKSEADLEDFAERNPMMMVTTTKALGIVLIAISTILSVSLLQPSDAFSTHFGTERRPSASSSSSSVFTLTTTALTSHLSATTVSDVVEAGTSNNDDDSNDSRRPEPPSISSLPLPPQKGGLFRRFRDTISYIRDPGQFIEHRSKELGPIFTMYQYFKPVVVVGGQDAVREFIKEKEKVGKVIYPDLPPTFVELHTPWSALNMDSTREDFKQARGLFRGLLQSTEARTMYVQTILPEIEGYVDTIVDRVRANPEEELFLVPELKELCLQIFSRVFSGEGTLVVVVDFGG